ncbi:MAG: hypothetical protein HC769_00265 [Cyanobacteria bacterium CRU_2_1]|nr:hypothetical protein [Cyanobacteria bacterium RU_5_0]NJR57413.1 hypothetical protein [Cyanobacteria bacterium CRU_2_1]
MLQIQGCQEIRWEVHDDEAITDLEADLIGITLGEDGYRQPAVIHTDIAVVS